MKPLEPEDAKEEVTSELDFRSKRVATSPTFSRQACNITTERARLPSTSPTPFTGPHLTGEFRRIRTWIILLLILGAIGHMAIAIIFAILVRE